MAEFINTIDVLGDDAVIDRLIDRTITEFRDNVITTIGITAFSFCTALEIVDLPEVTDLGNQTFQDTGVFKVFNAPKATTSGNGVFVRSQNTKITLPSLIDIKPSMFQYSRLDYADFSSAASIATCAFQSCPLTKLILRKTDSICVLSAADGVGYSVNIPKGTGYIYVPRALVDTYKAATNWSTYATQFRALEDYTVDGTITGELDETKI